MNACENCRCREELEGFKLQVYFVGLLAFAILGIGVPVATICLFRAAYGS